MMGVVITNTFFALQHFGGGRPQFKEQMELLALRLMRNPLWVSELHGPPRELTPPLSHLSASITTSLHRSLHTHSRATFLHPWFQTARTAVVPNFKPRYVLGCWACTECSKGRQAIVPIHPTQTNKHGQIRYWTCLCEHRANPFTYPRNRAKRVRSSPSSD